MENLTTKIASENLQLLKRLGANTLNLKVQTTYCDKQTGRVYIDPYCFVDTLTGEWMYDIKEFTEDIEPNTKAGAKLTPAMEQWNKEKLAEIGIEI